MRSHITGGTACYGHRRVYVVRSQINWGYDLLRASACVCCEITHHRGTICYWRRRVYVVRSRITGGTICYGHRRVYVVRSHITGGTICYGHRRVYVVRSHITRGLCMLELPGPGPKLRTSTWFQSQSFDAFNFQTLPTYKPSLQLMFL